MVIRPAEASDAKQLLEHLARLAEEPDSNLLLQPGELKLTLLEEEQYIRGYGTSDNSTMLVAEVKGRIVGELSAQGGKRAGTRHCVVVGISVAQRWRGKGVGTALMQALLDWAEGTGIIKRIDLDVFVRNTGAIKLYERFGFQIEGRRSRAAFKDGEYLDDYLMAKLLP